MERKPRDCNVCRAPCASNFKKVVELQDSCMEIYVHAKKDSLCAGSSKTRETFIIHNKSSHDIERPRYVGELCQYKTKCFQCKKIVQRVRELLQEFETIKGRQVVGVCEHCKSNSYKKCQRCEYITSKYLSDNTAQMEARQKRFKMWLCHVRNLLQALLEGNICKHKTAQEKLSQIELENLLQQIKEPLFVKEISAEIFPDYCDEKTMEYFKDSRSMIDDVMIKLKSHVPDVPCCSVDSLSTPPPKSAMCICKYFDRESIRSLSLDIVSEDPTKEPKPIPKTKTETKQDASPSVKSGASPGAKSVASPGTKPGAKPKSEVKSKRLKSPTPKPVLQRERSPVFKPFPKEVIKKVKPEAPRKIPKIASLPVIETRTKIDLDRSSSNMMECNVSYSQVPEVIIKHNALIPYNHAHTVEAPSKWSPLLFHVKDSSDCNDKKPVLNITETKTSKKATHGRKLKTASGVMKYELSNRQFIENGITILPAIKSMRKVKVYNTELAYESWFERNKASTKYYNTGEMAALADEEGFGQWFYKNGTVALEFYCSKGPSSTCRYVIYSCNEETVPWRQQHRTVLAVFDEQGNGVVYDHEGNIRLKYNQCEGIVKDKKIGPPGRWIWHTLHEQPILYNAYVEDYGSEIDLTMKEFMQTEASSNSGQTSEHTSMLVAELESYAKENSNEECKIFKSLEIRYKALKINDFFALRIFDQTNIRLIFRNGRTCLHSNIGTLLKSNEIIDILSQDLTEVWTPYDTKPARSKSLAEIQQTVERAKRISKRYSR